MSKCKQSDTVFITGAASGIGLEVAKRYAAMGANLALFDLRVTDEVTQSIIDTCQSPQQKVCFYSVDLRDREALLAQVQHARDSAGAPSLALNCAGVNNALGPFETLTQAQFEQVVQINLFGSRNFAEAVLPHLKEKARDNGTRPRLVFISSLAGLVGNFGYAPYCASKFGVNGLAQTLRIELKPMAIKVQLICPPEVDTPMVRAEHQMIHPATLKLKLMAGSLTLDKAVDGMMRGMRGRSFYIIPGMLAKLTYLLDRLLPGVFSRMLVDYIVAKTLKAHPLKGNKSI